ncbi:phosphoribosylglycinamide formyltransferase [Paenibacillus sp. HB172176]|uniref:phosphoribosylglycinamide formyltransferase n=1 Tax=Paenibacillus sp. HB172176 TaxID=2493690 RepID=UPI00143AD943|nr:phosphoribosylglycinamide formyltransferase [Paenibacillus sp. HB172176]
MAPLRIAVFASGNGTNFAAMVRRMREGKLDVSIELLVCDKASAPVIGRAQEAGIDTFVFRSKDYPSREDHDQAIAEELRKRGVELIVLAGYMRIITNVLVEPYYGRMINVHPSLLPSFPGVNAIQQALDHGVKVTGVSVHYVDGGLDSGPIIAQQAVEIEAGDTESTLAQRIHATEQQLLPGVIQAIAHGKVRLNVRKVEFH